MQEQKLANMVVNKKASTMGIALIGIDCDFITYMLFLGAYSIII
jgi:hypothetical protein